MLLDSFLLLFGFLSLLFYFRYRNNLHLKSLLWMGIFSSLAISIKWTGLTFLALPLIIEVSKAIRKRKVRDFKKIILFFIASPLMIYFLIFTVHFALLAKPGPGDAFMSKDFQNKNIVSKFLELNQEMFRSNQRLTATHPYSSQWHSWPLMARPVYYWFKNIGTDNARIYFIGNPLVWWASLISLLYLTTVLIINRFKDFKSAFLVSGYFLNLLPFIGIGRVMFLYHYLPALVFSILTLGYLMDCHLSNKKIAVFMTASAIIFIFFAPLTYGAAISEWYYKTMLWLPGWK